MSTVDYLPIANNPGANVDSQVDYLAAITSGSLENGYEAGLAKSAQINKTLRQCSVIAAAIANWISSINSADVLDDGDVDALVDSFALAVRVGTSGKGLDTGAANAYVVALVPAITSYVDGLEITFIATNSCTSGCTLNVGGGAKNLLRNDGTAMRQGDIISGDMVSCIYNLAATNFYMKSVTRSRIFQQGSALTSAATVDLFTAVGNYLHVTGSTGPITALGTAPAGYMAQVVFDSTPVITHNATSLILPGGANITAAAGDTAVFVSQGSGNWTCMFYQLAIGTPTKAGIQNQTYTSGTTGGSSTAFTLTPTPANTGLVTNSAFFAVFHTAAGSNPTLAVSGGTAKNLKYRNIAGTKLPCTATTTPSGWSCYILYDGTDYVQLSLPSSQTLLGTPQASTSGTTKDFVIPAGTVEIDVLFVGVSTNGTSALLVQIGSSSTPVATGYLCSASRTQNPDTVAVTSYTTGFGITIGDSSSVIHGRIVLQLQSSAANTWIASGVTADTAATKLNTMSAGSISLAGVCDILRITTVSADTFDAGSVNVICRTGV